MINKYIVSIVVVTYNSEKDIGFCLDSIRYFTDKKTEVIIIDGLSTDNTLDIINQNSDIINFLISEKDYGIYDAMNKGVKYASGEFIYFLGSDDTLAINFRDIYNILVNNRTIYYGDVILKPSNIVYDGKFSNFKLLNRNICHQSIFYPKNVFYDFCFNVNYIYMSDYVLNLQLWSTSLYSFTYINKVISNYSTLGVSSNKVDLKFKKDSFKIIYNNFGIFGLAIKSTNKLRKLFFNKNI